MLTWSLNGEPNLKQFATSYQLEVVHQYKVKSTFLQMDTWL